MTLWDEIMQKSPVMKELVENKIAEEKAPLHMEIAQLQQEKQELKERVALAEQALNDLILGV